MNQVHITEVEFKEAQELADHASIFQDFTFVIDVLHRLHDLLEEEEPDSIAAQAYWTSALITYTRCFSSGKRTGLSASIFKDIDGGSETHLHFKAMRDKHIAHSVNPFEQTQVGAMLAPPGAERKVIGMSAVVMRHISPTLDGVESLYHLAKTARKWAGTECERLRQASLAVAQTLDLDQLYRSAAMRTIAPDPEKASTPRS